MQSEGVTPKGDYVDDKVVLHMGSECSLNGVPYFKQYDAKSTMASHSGDVAGLGLKNLSEIEGLSIYSLIQPIYFPSLPPGPMFSDKRYRCFRIDIEPRNFLKIP